MTSERASADTLRRFLRLSTLLRLPEDVRVAAVVVAELKLRSVQRQIPVANLVLPLSSL